MLHAYHFQVLSGDTIVVREQPRGGPPPERTICLANIQAGRLSRRPNASSNIESKDEVLFLTTVFRIVYVYLFKTYEIYLL